MCFRWNFLSVFTSFPRLSSRINFVASAAESLKTLCYSYLCNHNQDQLQNKCKVSKDENKIVVIFMFLKSE